MKNKLTVQDWHWEITKACNLKCLHCIIGDRRNCELTTQESLIAVSRIVQLGGKNLRFTGGEPLMRKDLGLIIKEAYVDGGPVMKRMLPAPQGRAFRIRKRSAHLTLIVENLEVKA